MIVGVRNELYNQSLRTGPSTCQAKAFSVPSRSFVRKTRSQSANLVASFIAGSHTRSMCRRLVRALLLLACVLSSAVQPAVAAVLVIGDSISLGWMPFAQEQLPEVDFVHAQHGSTINNEGTWATLRVPPSETERRIDLYVEAEEPWDYIIYNSGIHDMRSLSNFQTTLPEYRENLETIYDVLESTGAPILWLTTTLIPDDHPNLDPTRHVGYRSQGIGAARERGHGVVDLYAATVVDFVEEYQIAPRNLHFNDDGSSRLAELVVSALQSPYAPSEFYFPDGNAPLWPLSLPNPNGIDHTGADFLAWQRVDDPPAASLTTELQVDSLDGQEFLGWQRYEASRPLHLRSIVTGDDFLGWQRHESSQAAGAIAATAGDSFLGWQRYFRNLPLDRRTRFTGSEFLAWQRFEAALYDDSQEFDGQAFLAWQRMGGSSSELIAAESAPLVSTDIATLSVPEPSSLTISAVLALVVGAGCLWR